MLNYTRSAKAFLQNPIKEKLIRNPSDSQPNCEVLPFAPALEEVTGVTFVPEGVHGITLESGTIRRFVYDALLKGARELRPHKRADDDLTTEEIAILRQTPSIQLLAAELQAANDTLLSWHHPPEMPKDTDDIDTPRGIVQATAMRQLVEHSQLAPAYSGNPNSPYSDGFLTVAPTGFGKTLLESLVLNYAGVGQPISPVMPQKRTAVGIIHSNVLLKQFLDPDGALQRFANAGGRTIKIGAHNMNRRNGHDEYDLLLPHRSHTKQP